jgi:hypothetical protein
MSNRVDGAIILDGGSANVDSPYGDGRLTWVVSPADVVPAAGPLSGSVTVEIVTGFGDPAPGVPLLSSPSALGGPGFVSAQGFYIRNDATGAGDILWWTVDGGTTWTAALI